MRFLGLETFVNTLGESEIIEFVNHVTRFGKMVETRFVLRVC